MADEPQDNETSQDRPEDTSPEGSDAATAGPVAEGGPPAHPPEGQPSTPPADETSEGQDKAPGAEEPAESPAAEGDGAAAEEPAESPVAEQSAVEAEAVEETEEPEPEKKKDVIPGADLEPIAVESQERPLSAEEQARREAEEEERRAREAALAGDSDAEEQAASRAPAKMEGDSRYLATGKRKNAIARVTLLPGSGKIEINGRPIEEFFPRPLHRTTASQPLTITGYESSVDVRVRVHGGGVSGQAGAVRHGIARALTEVDPELRGELKRRGFLTRDARAKERRKAGLKKARKRPQFSKR
jgi:small subunit ribosomal protein S9